MPTSTTFNQEEVIAEVEPRDRPFYTREGFDRKQIRYEFADVRQIDLLDKYVDEEEVSYVNPLTTDMPHGPTGVGEVGGSGVDFIREEGEPYPTFRYTQGFTALSEELRAGANDLSQQRDKVTEAFDWLADANFLKGITDRRDGSQIRPGVFQWLKANIPAERTFDCEDYDGDSGDVDDLLTDGLQENLIKYYAFQNISGKIMDNSNTRWDLMIGNQRALARFNQRVNSEGGTDPRDTYWERINAEKGIGVGIDEWRLIPDTLVFSEAPPDMAADEISVDLTSELGDDEVILLPDMEQVRQKYWRLHEMSSPELFDPVPERGGKQRFDYAWRYSHNFDPTGKHGDVTDAVHITNLSVLFQ